MLRILHNTSFDFIKRARLVTILMSAFLLPALIWMLADMARGGPGKLFNLGIEFTSGTAVEVQFREPPDLAEVRQVVGQAVPGVEVQTYGSPRDIVLRAQDRQHLDATASGAESVSTTISRALEARFGAEAFTVRRTDALSPRVGAELRRNAIIAMLISFVVTLLYLAWRFDARLAMASVLANVHDILATFAFIKYAQIELSLFVVGGILTVIGYSLADKVVVFDRVRELLRKGGRRALRDTLNVAINETLPRTVMTGSTVIACLLALIFLGGEVLRPFAMVLLFGIIIGTFSSIYVASPILLLLEKKWPRGDGETKGMKRALAEERKHDRTEKKAGTMAAR
ncbi:MAG TPA: protein translocase subunit SecF [Gemmatimonadaceae bacterium]|nr:protein translocase subunit SecF [Gemmatimonadaceae bacterium]